MQFHRGPAQRLQRSTIPRIRALWPVPAKLDTANDATLPSVPSPGVDVYPHLMPAYGWLLASTKPIYGLCVMHMQLHKRL
jgi:hypothetical protein